MALSRAAVKQILTFADPKISRASRAASHVWCVTSAEKSKLAKYTDKISLMPEVGTKENIGRTRSLAGGETLHVIWSGAHRPNKALPILVRAIAQLRPESNLRVHVLGAGPGNQNHETKRARRLTETLNVSAQFIWHGHLPRSEALELMRTGHVLVHTSLIEATSTVIMEALSLGLPVICHDACGMATAVTPDCGIKIPMSGINGSIQGFAQAIQSLLDNPKRIGQLSQGAMRRSETLSWERKMIEINRVYTQVSQSQEPVEPRITEAESAGWAVLGGSFEGGKASSSEDSMCC